MMKLTQKHTCFGCKALYWDKGEGLCRLGYETAKMINTEREIVPVEPCPKPMTKADMNTANTIFKVGATLQENKNELLTALKLALEVLNVHVFNLYPTDTVAQAQKQVIESAIKKAEGK
jgi:hypothetical protein